MTTCLVPGLQFCNYYWDLAESRMPIGQPRAQRTRYPIGKKGKARVQKHRKPAA
ncbi:MAG: hypothetical protein KME08_19265 [Aphanothece sp. CMT-3BRIN-NPC111]|nr:hypothetical protein [Aphanothece sp. CMT-3BRIN-NPC111]